MTARNPFVRLGTLIVAALTALLVTALPAAAEVTGTYVGTVPGGEGDGFRVKDGDGSRDVYASLLGIDLDGDGDAELATYCVEIDVDAIGGVRMVESPWSEFPGGDGDLANPEKVLWILHNGYPSLDVDELAEASGVEGITKKDAITATQAAIWHFANGAEMHDNNPDRLIALYDYLTGDANTGMEEQPPASLSLDPAEIADVTVGDKAGPFTVHTNATEVELTLDGPDGVQLVDADGNPLTGPVAEGAQFWLSSPTGGELGPATVTARAEARVERGRLFVGDDNRRTRTQTLIVATSEKGQAVAEASAGWKTAPTTTTTTEQTTTETTAPPSTTGTTVAPTTAPPPQGGGLPNTGASVLGALGLGVLLVGGGIAILVLQRRRNSGQEG
ncbi:MAG TPA: thioester domain-containing protein [Pseudonocardiaceae bacterium]